MKTMLTLDQAVDYLWSTRRIKVKRQSVYNFAQQHILQCEKMGAKKRPILLLIPTRLLDTYTPSERHQANGKKHQPKIA